MILGFFWFLVANAAVLGAAWTVLRRLRLGDGSVDLVLFLLLRLTFISLLILLAGLTGNLTAFRLGMVGVLTLAILAMLGAHLDLPRLRLSKVGRGMLFFAGLILVRLAFQVWFFSPHLGDATAYHLPKIAEWVRAGAFTREMGVHTHVTFPAGFELIETWWVVFLHHDVLIEAAGVEFLFLGSVAVHALSKYVGLSARSAFLAALIYALVPGFHLSATSCMNDAPAAALIVATMAMAAYRVSWPLLLMAAGLGLGTKPIYGFAVPGMLLLAFLARRKEAGGSSLRWDSYVLGALGLAIGSFWYLRNLIWFGNAFYPLGSPGFVDPTPVQFGVKFSSLAKNLLDLANVRIYDRAAPLGANVDDMAGWGPAVFACAGVGLVWGSAANVRIRILAGSFLLSLCCTLALVQNDPYNLKYVFFFPAVLAISVAWLTEYLPASMALTWATLAFSFMATFFPYDLPFPDFRILARQPWKARSAAALPSMEADLGNVEAVGYFGSTTGPTYLLYGPDFSRRVVYLRCASAKLLLYKMEQEGLQWLYAYPEHKPEKKVLEEALQSGRLKHDHGRVYRLN